MNITLTAAFMRSFLTLLSFLFSVSLSGQETVVRLRSDTIGTILDEVVLSTSRLPERLLQSPVTIEKINAARLLSGSAPSFFDALQSVKGVQMITPSLGFRVINTRGFTNTTNVRFAQLVDGMDIQSPHIGAPVGNALGPGDLDIQSVEIIPGAAAALYGMNTINGMANFFTKDPVTTQGLSVQQKTGVNHVNSRGSGARLFSETSVRFAHVFSPRFAFKINGTFTGGYDWIADDSADLNYAANSTTGLPATNNPGRDAVNGYGNESSNRRTLALGGKSYVVARSGYAEREVTDYAMRNTKADLGFYFRPWGRVAINYTYHLGVINAVYQRANRFRLQGYLLQQHAVEVSSASLKIKAYLNTEHTGKSYNLRSMAENIDRAYRSDDEWFSTYTSTYNSATTQGVSAAPAHDIARAFADNGRLQPGTPTFSGMRDRLQDINNWDSGAALRVQAKLLHAEAQLDVTKKYLARFRTATGLEILAGADGRTYLIFPDGNYFINPVAGKAGSDIRYSRWGSFVSLTRKWFEDRLKTAIVARADKNDHFDVKTNLRASVVYSLASLHHLRFSYQHGYRYPSIFEAYSNVNSGGVKRVGGLRVMSSGIFENGWLKSSIDAFQAAVNRDINSAGLTRTAAIEKNKKLLARNAYTYLQPERVQALELGYKGWLVKKRLFIDLDLYLNLYRSFIAQVEMSVPNTIVADGVPAALYDRRTQSRYRMWTNSRTRVHQYGAGMQLQYNLPGGYQLDGNLSYAALRRNQNGDGLEDGFNTPRWMCNIILRQEHLLKRVGASVSWRWQDSFYWQSFLVNGDVPAMANVDAQLTYLFAKHPLRLKLGATNLLNKYQVAYLGGPQVGGLYYSSLTFGLP